MEYPKLEKIMVEKNITRYRLAKQTGIAPTDIYGALSGNRKMYSGWKKRIAAALDVEVSDIFDEE